MRGDQAAGGVEVDQSGGAVAHRLGGENHFRRVEDREGEGWLQAVGLDHPRQFMDQ